jgi:hypothetical protein
VLRLSLTMSLLLMALPLEAEIVESGEHGFTVSHSITVEVEPFVVYRTMTSHIDQWWNPDHSWSGDAANLHMELKRGGCFCEHLPNGGYVEHLRIIYLSPGAEIRFDGALGPLQTMPVQGRMIWKIEAVGSGSKVSFTYMVFGHPDGGLTGIAPAVDGMIGEQLLRLGDRHK